ncbi:D-sedoheptulose-7-phosphate isomerase [Porticoccus sp. GXU_MW_L64]
MEQRVIELFHRSIEAKMNVGEGLAPLLASASQRCVASLLEGRKLLCAGNGVSAAMASILCQNLLHQYRLERPGFAAISLSGEAGLLTGIGSQHNFSEVFSRQVKTLGETGDLLVLFSTGEDPANLSQAAHAAHDRGLNIIAFTAPGDHNLRSLLADDDLDVCADHPDVHRVQEIQLLSLFALCDLIDDQLFGGID